MGSLFKIFRKARKLHEQVEEVREIKEQVEGVVHEIRGGVPVAGVQHQHPGKEAPPVTGPTWTPGSKPEQGGTYLLFRNGHPVFEHDGDWHTCLILDGGRLPPGWQRGDVWRLIDERG